MEKKEGPAGRLGMVHAKETGWEKNKKMIVWPWRRRSDSGQSQECRAALVPSQPVPQPSRISYSIAPSTKRGFELVNESLIERRNHPDLEDINKWGVNRKGKLGTLATNQEGRATRTVAYLGLGLDWSGRPPGFRWLRQGVQHHGRRGEETRTTEGGAQPRRAKRRTRARRRH